MPLQLNPFPFIPSWTKGVDSQSNAVTRERWFRKPEDYTYAKTFGDNIGLIPKAASGVATTQTNKDCNRTHEA